MGIDSEHLPKADGHPLRGCDGSDRPPNRQQLKDDLLHGEVQLLVSDELDDLDKEAERGVAGHNLCRTLGKQGVDDALEPGLCHPVALALDPDHVHPEQPLMGQVYGH